MPSTTEKQARFMAFCSHTKNPPESCPPKKVSKEFNKADKGTKLLKKAMSFKEWVNPLHEGKTDSISHYLVRDGDGTVTRYEANQSKQAQNHFETAQQGRGGKWATLTPVKKSQQDQLMKKLNKMRGIREASDVDLHEIKDDHMHMAQQIANKHKVPVDQILDQVRKGTKVEYEHTDSTAEATKIAFDHLKEMPNYYTKLHKMETGKC